ncbi:MAG: signal peptidase II [Patescibacteria group bacterium]
MGVALAVVFDQWSKWFFVHHQERTYGVVSGLSLDFTRNYGLAFGLSANRWVIVVISILLMGFLFWFARAEWKNAHPLAAVASLLMGVGALSNLVDRLRFGYVVDWISVQYWSVFNLADVWITLGAILIVIQYWKHDYGKKTKTAPPSAS